MICFLYPQVESKLLGWQAFRLRAEGDLDKILAADAAEEVRCFFTGCQSWYIVSIVSSTDACDRGLCIDCLMFCLAPRCIPVPEWLVATSVRHTVVLGL